jgi:hypothetical protein
MRSSTPICQKSRPSRPSAPHRAPFSSRLRARAKGRFATIPFNAQREAFAGRVAIMLSKLATGLWRLIREGFMARGGRYWLT